MKRAGWTLLVMGTIVVTGSFSKVGAVDASGWAHCASVKQDTERLACYDAMAAGTAERRTLGSGRHSERDAMISRCRTQMGEYGSAMVKACVDQDSAAYKLLQTYPDDLSPFIQRCVKHMGEYGWSMVKACADQDIAAERALQLK